MGYNYKIIRSGNDLEVWKYEKQILTGVKLENVSKKKQSRRKFEDLSDDEKDNSVKRMDKTRKNAKWELRRLVQANASNKMSFLTLTTKENIQDRNEFNTMLIQYISRLTYKVFKTKKRVMKYICALERQTRGAYHAHLILFDIPFISFNVLHDTWGHGGVRINKIDGLDSINNVSRYVVKYMEKGIQQELERTYGKKSYTASRNLRKPEVVKLYTHKDFDEMFDGEIVYEATYVAKAYENGEFVDNNVVYHKYQLRSEGKDDNAGI